MILPISAAEDLLCFVMQMNGGCIMLTCKALAERRSQAKLQQAHFSNCRQYWHAWTAITA